MSSEATFEISIPTDDDGYILLKCGYCGEFFKCTPSDLEDDSILNISCPSCGLISENYLTDDVIELAMNKAENYAMDMVHTYFKELERRSSNGILQFKAGSKPNHKREDPIRSGIEALTEKEYKCCVRSAKIKPMLKMTASYCPFCGVITFADE